MKWHWKVRIYGATGNYWHCQIETGRDLTEIDHYQDFYYGLTGCKMLLEGMSENKWAGIAPLSEAFHGLWVAKI